MNKVTYAKSQFPSKTLESVANQIYDDKRMPVEQGQENILQEAPPEKPVKTAKATPSGPTDKMFVKCSRAARTIVLNGAKPRIHLVIFACAAIAISGCEKNVASAHAGSPQVMTVSVVKAEQNDVPVTPRMGRDARRIC